jgi:hypothetical protein
LADNSRIARVRESVECGNGSEVVVSSLWW